MTQERDIALMKTQNKLMDALSVSVKISHDEALKVVVNDLVEKYKSCVSRGDAENEEAFSTVLKYYIGEEAFNQMIPPKHKAD
jgi:hypothetical protein